MDSEALRLDLGCGRHTSEGFRGAFQDPTHVSFWNENSFLDMDMNGEYRYGADYCFNVSSLRTTIPDSRQVCWVQVVLQAVK